MVHLSRFFDFVGGQQVLRDRPGAPSHANQKGDAPKATPEPPPNAAPPPHFRPDPSTMYLRSPFEGELYQPEHPALATIAECLRARSARLDHHWKLIATWLGEDDLAYARRLCRQLAPDDWRHLLALFADALLRARFDRDQRWRDRDRQLPEGWAERPWYYVDPWHGAAELAHAKDLGFENVALLTDVRADVSQSRNVRLERLIEKSRELDLRVAIGVDFGAAPDDLTDWCGGVFKTLAAEANLGILGLRTHGVDRWLADPQRAHTLHALIKLFLRMLGRREIVIPEISPKANVLPFAGGGVVVRGKTTTSEGDLLHWHDAMDALRDAVKRGNVEPLMKVLDKRPRVLNGANLTVSIEHHDEPNRASLATMVDHDPVRLAGALALLYALPATPIVYYSRELTEAAVVADALRDLNEHFDPKADVVARNPSPGAVELTRGRRCTVVKVTAPYSYSTFGV